MLAGLLVFDVTNSVFRPSESNGTPFGTIRRDASSEQIGFGEVVGVFLNVSPRNEAMLIYVSCFPQYFAHVIVAIEVLYDATCLISMLLTFRSELLRLAGEWANMRHSDSDQKSFREKLKQNVKEHVELIT